MVVMSGEPDYFLDIDGLGDDASAPADPDSSADRRWLGIHYECCGVYGRVYRNREGTTYEGRCPRCLGRVQLPIGPDGTDQRFFVAR